MIVMKFGGTSVKTASAMRSAAACVVSHLHRRPLVVLSACGGITNSLLRLARCAGSSLTHEKNELLAYIEQHHRTLCLELFTSDVHRRDALESVDGLLLQLREYVDGMLLLCECTDQSLDMVASFGERLSSAIFARYLCEISVPGLVVDARTFMKTSADFTRAAVDMTATRNAATKHLLPAMSADRVIVTQGFLGSTSDNDTTTLGRGGSDVSAAILGAVLAAEEIQIWTDVSGVLTADPRVVPHARTLPDVTFSELRDLSFFGAKVLHADTIKPAIDAGVPVTIRNTFDPDNTGTRAVPDDTTDATLLRAVTARTGCVRIVVKIPVQSSGNEQYERLLAIARKRFCDVIVGTQTDSEVMIVVPAEHAPAFTDLAECRPADVVCVCGPALRVGTNLDPVMSVMSRHNPFAIMPGLTSTSCCAVVEPVTTTELVRRLHDCLTA